MKSKKAKLPPPEPPVHLSARATALWRSLVPSRARSAGRLTLLQTALECLDRADAARAAVEVEGLTSTTKSTGAVHVHPLVRVEREARQQFAKIWHDQLHFGFDAKLDGQQESIYWEPGDDD